MSALRFAGWARGAGRPSLVALNSAAEMTSHEFRVMYNKALLQASGSGSVMSGRLSASSAPTEL